MTEEEINKKAEKHCNEVLCNAHEKCNEVIKCRDWRSRRAGFYCGYEQATKELQESLVEWQKTCEAKSDTNSQLIEQLAGKNEQLTKAKEIIREFIDNVERYSINNEILDKAEAFLKE